MTFDPDAASTRDGIFGLPHTVAESRFVVVPVPFDATTSYRDGTRNGPAAVYEASQQVDLFDLDFGRPYNAGIAMLESGAARRIAALNREARKFAEPVIASGGDRSHRREMAEVNRRSAAMNGIVERTVAGLIAKGKTPVVLGGDHSTPFGAIKAYVKKFPALGILHIDAHADLREAFEGFEWSHASIMHNVMTRLPVRRLVQVGIRDFGEREHAFIRRDRRIRTHFDARLHRDWGREAKAIVADLPREVYISLDIDGFDPSLCPDTGTPVPGGLSFNEFLELMRVLAKSRRRIVGFDLNEVAPNRKTRPADWGGDLNANVGARVLYKMIGAASV